MKQRLVFALLMGIFTTALISFALVAINEGFGSQFWIKWFRSWAIAYVLAVLSILIVSPRIQQIVNALFHKQVSSEKIL